MAAQEASQLGVDDRACSLLETIPLERQTHIVAKLQEGVNSGTVRNPSAFVVGAVNGMDGLDLDDGASEMLKALPKFQRKEVIDKLKKATDVRNPSAWVVKSVQQSKGKGCGKVFGGGAILVSNAGFSNAAFSNAALLGSWDPTPAYGSMMHLDDAAKTLLKSLPPAAQAEILQKLKNGGTSGEIRNPSAWVAKAALKHRNNPPQAIQAPQPSDYGWATKHATLGTLSDPAALGAALGLDDNALELLQTLPSETQEDIMQTLQHHQSKGIIRNPSAWVAKAALGAGAEPQASGLSHISSLGSQVVAVSRPGSLGLDASASALLSSLPATQQETIISKLQELQAKGGISNPSGWVVKACLNAGAKTQGKGKGRPSPY